MDLKTRIKRIISPKTEIMHYKLNKASGILALLAIAFNALMFLHIYGITGCRPDIVLGVDLVVNIVFMLFAFLCSENTKKYDIKAAYVSIGLGIIEIIRIFIIPVKYHNQYLKLRAEAYEKYMAAGDFTEPFKALVDGLPNGDFTYVVILMLLSAACLIGAGVIGILKTRKLENYLKTVDNTRRD